jgi:CubicO group peptidase (beta-lactamase class C family)
MAGDFQVTRYMKVRGSPPRGFGHFGFGGSGAWADPSRDLAFAMIVNCGMGTPFGDLRIARTSGAALACADHRSAAAEAEAEETAEGVGEPVSAG